METVHSRVCSSSSRRVGAGGSGSKGGARFSCAEGACALIAIVVAALSGCQFLIDVEDRQCTADTTCVDLLGQGFVCSPAGVCATPGANSSMTSGLDGRQPLPARWACVREPVRDFVPDPTRTISMRMNAFDVVSLQAPAGLVATACVITDLNCQQPVVANVTPGPDSFLEFNLPHGFEGFIRLVAPGLVSSSWYDNRPHIENVTTAGPPMIPPPALAAITSNSGIPLDPNAGEALLDVRDCNDMPAENVRFEAVKGIAPFYLDGVLPSRDLQSTKISTTLTANREPRAVAGFQNLPTGYTTITATLVETGETACSLTVQIRAGEITWARMRAGY